MEDELFDLAPECLLIIDSNKKVLQANKKLLLLFQSENKDSLHLEELRIFNNYKEMIFSPEHFNEYFKNEFENNEIEIIDTTGKTLNFLLSYKKIDYNNQIAYYLALRNISEIIYYKKIFEELYNNLSSKTIELDAALHEKQITNKLLQEKEKEMERQLNIAKQIQTDLFPHFSKQYPKFEITSISLAATIISGDLLLFHERTDNKLDIVIADVTGHGIPAAFITMLIKMSLQTAILEFDDPIYILEHINNDMHKILANSAIFATIMYARLNLDTGEMIVLNCGHPPPIIKRKNNSIEIMEIGGILLGVVPSLDFNVYNLQLEPDEVIIFYTDGLTESNNPNKVFYEKFFIQNLQTDRYSDSANFERYVLEDLRKFTETDELQDDITIVRIKYL